MMNQLTRYRQHELGRANAENESHVRRGRYRSASDDERRQKLAQVRQVVVEVKRRPSSNGYASNGVWVAGGERRVDKALVVALDCWEEEAAERRLWWAVIWVLVFGCGAAYLLTLVIFGWLLAGG